MFRVKAIPGISKIFIKLKLISGGSISSIFIKEARVLAFKLSRIRKEQGVKGLTFYLKSCSIALQQSLAGYRIHNMTLVGPRISRTKSGLPRIICRSHRLIMSNRKPGCYFLMKYYLSIFYFYRVLEFPGKLKLETITSPGKLFNMNHYESYMDHFIRIFFPNKLKGPGRGIAFLRSVSRVFPIFRSSPFTNSMVYFPFKTENNSKEKGRQLWSTHVISLIESMRAVMLSPLYPLYKEMADILKFEKLINYFKYQKGMTLKGGVLEGPLLK